MLKLLRARVPAALLPPALVKSPVDSLEPVVLCDLSITGDVLSGVELASPSNGAGDSDLAGSLVFPAFVDCHVHLDKTHTWHRAPNRSGTFLEALQILGTDKNNWTAADLQRRAGFALRTAWAHGTRIIRTHVDTGLPWAETSHAVMADLRQQWRGRIELQTVPLCGGDAYASATGEAVADLALRYGATALGGFLQMSAQLPAQLDRLLAIARDRKVGIDLHVDENGNPQAECLRLVAEAVLRNSFSLPVACGHCCSLAVQDPERQRSTIALVKEARIGIVTLPQCNLYLQDRRTEAGVFPRSPLRRGLTLVNDFFDAGVPVAAAGDNVRDAFHAFGDYDMLEVYGQSVRLAHLDANLAESVKVVTSTAADLVGRPQFGRIAVGAPARLVVCEAKRFSELLSRAGAARRCLDGEQLQTLTPPDFAELHDAER